MAKFFISHSSTHKSFCDSIRTALSGTGHEAWLDSFDIHAGDSIPSTIVDGIYASDYFVLIVTPEVHASKWVPWELNVATYREIETLGRTFVLPGTRVPTTPVRLLAHKNHIDMTGSADDAALLLAALVGGLPAQAPSLPIDAHAVVMEMKPVAGGTFSTRELEEAFWSAIPEARHYSFFPAAIRGHLQSVGPANVVIGLNEGERSTSTILSRDGSVRIAETNFSGEQCPVVLGALLVRKIARFIKLTNDISKHLGAGDFALSVRLAGTDRRFRLSYDPREAAVLAPGSFRSEFDLPAGHPLVAKLPKVRVANRNLAPEQIANLTDQIQADLFHALRVRRHPAVGGGEFSIRYSTESVTRYTKQALQNIWGP